jgi:WD40 repeat protein
MIEERMDKPANLGLQLLILAGEAIAQAIDGCAQQLRLDAGAAVAAAAPDARTAVGREAIDHFGPLIVARWASWFAAQGKPEQERALRELGGLTTRDAQKAANQVVDQIHAAATADDKRVAAAYLAAVPTTTRSILIPDAESGQLVPASLSLDERTLLRLLPINAPPFAVGAEVPGTPYLLEEMLGSGGFGVVYRATNRFEQHTPPRAIKFCLNMEMLASLRRERDLLNRLMAAGANAQWSDRIVKLYGHNLDVPIPFLVYEYVAGGSLIARLAAVRRQTGKHIRPAQVLGLIRRICEAIAFPHSVGLVHRDIKPSNILVSGNTIKLADFGIGEVVAAYAARSSHLAAGPEGLTVSQTCNLFRGAGTPLYMSPEQRQGAPPEPHHDIYSMGVLWYQLLIGDFSRELHAGWADELAEEFDVPQKQIELIAQCVGYAKKRPASGKELLALLPSPALVSVPATRSDLVGEVRTCGGHDGRINSVAFLRDSRRVLSAAGDGTARLWDAQTGNQLACFRVNARAVLCAAVSPDNRAALLGCDDRNAWLVDLSRKSEPRCFAGHALSVNAAAFSPDGRRAVTGGADGTIRVWHVAAGREILCIDEERRPVTGVAFSPDGLLIASCSENGALRLWDSETGWEAQTLTAQGGLLLCLAMAPDGRKIVAGGKDGLSLWSLETGRLLGAFEGHSLAVSSVAFSVGGEWLISGGMDKSVRLWEVASRRLVHTFEHRTFTIRSVAFAPDGHYAASAGDDRTVRLWALPRLERSGA